jgi:hypothetical protein
MSAPGGSGWLLFADEVSTTYDKEHNSLKAVVGKPIPQTIDVNAVVDQLNDPALLSRGSSAQIQQLRDVLTHYQQPIGHTDDKQIQDTLKQLASDLSDPSKDLGLTLTNTYDKLSPFLRASDAADNVVTVLDQTQKHQTVRVTDGLTGAALFTQETFELNPVSSKKIIRRPLPNDPSHEVIDAIVFEYTQGAAKEQRVVYNRRVELLLKNLVKLYYDQPSLARKIKDNCNVSDPTNHQPAAQIGKSASAADDNMTDNACKKMVEIFDGKRADFITKTKADGFDVNIISYLAKLAAAAKAGTLDQLDWKELQAVQRKAMQFYNDNQLETMQKMVLIELKTYFSQVTNATVKEDKNGTEALDATMKDLGELQKIFDEFKQGNFDGYSLLMTKFFAKADIEDPKYVSKDIMLLASESFADVANAVAAQKRLLQPNLSGEEIDATVEESQQWLKLAQVHLQEFDMHTMAIQLERLQSGHLRDHLGLRTDDLKFTVDGKEYTLSAKGNQDEALNLANVANTQYLPALEKINGEIKANLIKQAIASFYLTYENVTRALLYDDGMQERVRTLSGKITELRDLYLSLEFDLVKDTPKFKGMSETEKLKGNLYEKFINDLAQDNPEVFKTKAALDSLAKKFDDLAQIQSADRIRADIKPLRDEFVRLQTIIMQALTGQKDPPMPLIDDVKKQALDLGVRQAKLFGAVQDFSSQARIYDMMNELDLYCAKYASSEFVTSKGDTAASKAIGMKWWDAAMNFILGGHRDDIVDAGMKINPLTQKAFKALGENKDERHRIMLLMAQGKFTEAIERIAALDPNHVPVQTAIKALNEKRSADALAQLDKLDCTSAQRDAIKALINGGKFTDAIAALRKLDGALRAQDEYEADKAIADPFEAMDFDGALTKSAENPSLVAAQGVIQNMFGQLQSYIMGYTLTAAVLDTVLVSALTLGLGAVSRYAIGAAKGIVAFGEALQAAKAAESVGEVSRMARVLRTLVEIGKFIISIPGKIIVYAGKWLESSMISIRNTLGIANISKDLSVGQTAWQIVRIGLPNALKFQVKNAVIMGGASAGIQAASYEWDPNSSQYKSVWDASKQGLIQGIGFGAKSGLFILGSPVPVSAFGEGTVGNVVRTVADSAGPVSSLTQGVAKLVASDSMVAEIGPLGALKQISLSASPGFYVAAKALVWGGAMLDGAAKYMLASAVAHNVASVGEYYEYKLTHANDGEKEGATVEMQALSQGEAFGMTMAEMSWLLLPVHQASNDKAVKTQIDREDAFNAAINQGLVSDIAQSNGVSPVLFDKPWGMQSWGERAEGVYDKVTGKESAPPKGQLFVDGNLRTMANKIEMKDMDEAQLIDIKTTPRENIGKYRLKAELGQFDKAQYANEPIQPAEGEPGAARFSKPEQGGDVDLRSLNMRVTDEAISTADELLTKKLQGKSGAQTRLEILRVKSDIDAAAGQIRDAAGELSRAGRPEAERQTELLATLDAAATKAEGVGDKSQDPLVKLRAQELADSARELADLVKEGKAGPEAIQKLSQEVKGTAENTSYGRRLQSLAETVGKVDLTGQGNREPGTFWQRLKDMVKGSPVETPSEAIVRNLKGEVDVKLSDQTASDALDMDAAAKEVKDAAAELKGRIKKILETPASVEGTADAIKESAAAITEAADRLEKAADKLGDKGLKKQAVDLATAGRRIAEQAQSDKFTAAGIGDRKDAQKAVSRLTTVVDAIDSAGDTLSDMGAKLEASELSRKASGAIKSEMETRIGDKLSEATRLRAAGKVDAADALEREALALKTMRPSLEADALLQYVNEGMARDFQAYRRGEISGDKVDRAIELFIASWENGVMGPSFKNKFGFAIDSFRDPQRDMIRQILHSMAEGHEMTMGLLKTGGGKTLISFVLLSFMDTLARQKGKQGAIFVTVNGDLVAQAFEDYRAFFNGRDPSFQIKTVSDFMADEAMAQSTGGMSPFKTHDVVFDEFDLLGTITKLSLGSDNGRLSFPELDPVQKSLQKGVVDLHDFFQKYKPEIGENVDGRKLMDLINAKGTPLAQDFEALRGKYVNAVRDGIAEVRSSDFKAQLMDFNSDIYKGTGITNREQFMNKFGMSPEQVLTQMRDEQDHAFGGGWRKLWDVGVIQRQHGGLDGYVTKTFLGGIQALSQPDLAKFYDAKLDPSGKKLVQYHNDVPLDNLDTLYRTYLELKHGIPLTLDFDNLTVVSFSDINRAAKKSGATVVALSGTLPSKLREFMESPDVGWNILGEAYGGQRVNYQKMDPLTKGTREALSLMQGGKLDAALARVEKMDLSPEGREAIASLLKEGNIDAAAAKLTELAPANSQYHEVVAGIRELADASKPGAKNLGVFYADSKTAYQKFEVEMDALNPKFTGDQTTESRYNDLAGRSRELAEQLGKLRGDPNARGEFAKTKAEYLKIETELDPLRTIPRQRRVVAVTPDSNFLVQEWLMPEAIEAKNLDALKKGQAEAVILIGQSGFRGLDLNFRAYANGRIKMFVSDPGTLSTVNRIQLTGRIDWGRMPPGATPEIVGLIREDTILKTGAYQNFADNAFNEAVNNGPGARWQALQGVLRDYVPAGKTLDETMVRDYLAKPPAAADEAEVKTYADARYLYEDMLTLRDLGKIVKPEDLQAALKDPAAAKTLAQRSDVAQVLLSRDGGQTVMQKIMSDLQDAAEYESLKSSGIFDGPEPNVFQQLMMRLRPPRAPAAAPIAVPAP